jgi:hypothetical protein
MSATPDNYLAFVLCLVAVAYIWSEMSDNNNDRNP